MGRSGAGDGVEPLSRGALRLYARLAEVEQEVPATDGEEDELQELLAYGLVRRGYFRPDSWVAVPPWSAEGELLAAERHNMSVSLARMNAIPDAMEKAAAVFTAGELHISPRSHIIENREEVNSQIERTLEAARREVVTAQPGSRTRTAISIAAPRDQELLRQGVALRTLYHPSSRTNPYVQEYVETVTELGAEVRTLGVPFPRMILVDNAAAFVALKLDGAPEHAALHTTDPAHVAWILRGVFDAFWPLGEVWTPTAQAPAVSTDGIETTVLRLLLDGHTQRSIEPRVGLSKSGLDRVIADLKQKYGATSLFQLGVKWRDAERAQRA